MSSNWEQHEERSDGSRIGNKGQYGELRDGSRTGNQGHRSSLRSLSLRFPHKTKIFNSCFTPRYRPPSVYVRPTSTMALKDGHRHVDREGLVYMPYLHEWAKHSHNLVTMCQNLSQVRPKTISVGDSQVVSID